ncbi:hypothetical protein SAMN04487880_2797 [Marinobacter sp. es.042]|nr:hypothetical protein SAMN04487880_2797 [Marinobacter sp. es.042]
MQDAQQKCWSQAVSLFMILALGLVSSPSHSSDSAPAPLYYDSALCPLLSDVTCDGGQEGGLSHGNRTRDFSLYPAGALPGIRSYSGVVHCASFPVLPQAPPGI